MTDFRALCVELTDCLEKADWPLRHRYVFRQWIDIARAALADEPAAGEPVSVTGQPSDEELYDYWISTSPEFGCADPVGYARAVLARWGNPAPQPPAEPIVPTVMEIVELADEIEAAGLGQVDLVRAALTRWGNPAPQPVPVSERLPGAEDCDTEGRYWGLINGCEAWVLGKGSPSTLNITHCLPAHALPIPHQQENAND